MIRKTLFGKEAREKLVEGCKFIYECVAVTLSPKGRNVLLPRQWGPPIVVHDGVTVAKEVQHEDPFANEGVKLIRQASLKTNEEAGDGTTTSVVLAYHLVSKAQALIDNGKNAMELRNELNATIPILKAELEKIKTPVSLTTPEDITKVAFISAADMPIAQVVTDAISKVGKDGLIAVEDYSGNDMILEHTEGMQFDKGFSSVYFITNEDRMEAEIEDPAVIVVRHKITMGVELQKIVDPLLTAGKKQFVIIGSVSGEALAVLIKNKIRGKVFCLTVDVPGMAARRDNYLDDIALLTGAGVVSPETGFTMEMVGSAQFIVAGEKTTAIIKGKGDKARISTHVEQLRARIQSEQSLFEREKLEERLAKLTTGAAVIRVGGKTEVEARDRKERVKDAVSAAKAALDEGIVPGGGVAFIKLAQALGPDIGENWVGKHSDGATLMRDVLHEPVRKLLENSGETDVQKIEDIMKQIGEGSSNIGYNVNTGLMGDLVEQGVIDPAKVIRLSLENATSVANMIITTECLMADFPDPLERRPELNGQD